MSFFSQTPVPCKIKIGVRWQSRSGVNALGVHLLYVEALGGAGCRSVFFSQTPVPDKIKVGVKWQLRLGVHALGVHRYLIKLKLALGGNYG